MRTNRYAWIALLGTAMPVVAQQPVPNRSVVMPPMGNFVPGYQQRAGRQTIVEFVPKGQTVEHYTKLITLNTFPVPAGTTEASTLAGFAQRYRASCGGTTVTPVPLANGQRGVRMDCSRSPKTGRSETVFARAVAMQPEMAIVQYMTTYLTMPDEAAAAREFLGKVTVR